MGLGLIPINQKDKESGELEGPRIKPTSPTQFITIQYNTNSIPRA